MTERAAEVAFLSARTGLDAATVERGVRALRLYACAAGAVDAATAELDPAEVERVRRTVPIYVVPREPGDPKTRPVVLCMRGEVEFLRRVAGLTLECALSFAVAEARRVGPAQGRYAEVEAGELAAMMSERAN